MKPLYLCVLGAGASRDAGFPLYRDILDPVYLETLREYLHTHARELLPLRLDDGLKRLQERCLSFRRDGEDLESLLNQYMSANPEKAKDLLSYYSLLIRSADNLFNSHGTPNYLVLGLVPILVAMARAARVAVLSFNHDLLIELSFASQKDRAIFFSYYLDRNRTSHLSDVWVPQGDPFIYWPSETFFKRPADIERCSPIPLLKLHGSFNWLQCTRCEAILVERVDLDDVVAKIVCPKCKGAFRLGIVPPKRVKQIEGFASTWTCAKQLVRDARLVTFIGYSLPEYDEDALRLFRENLREDAAIVVIAGNISPEMKTRYEKLAGKRRIEFFSIGLIDFLSGLLGGSDEMSAYRGLLYHHFCTMLECDPGLPRRLYSV